MYYIKQFDPYLQMPEQVLPGGDFQLIEEDLKYWEGMLANEFQGQISHVTLNTDNDTDPSTYFMTFHSMNPNIPTQVDVFHVIRDDQGDDDVSTFGGAQCRDCGIVNVTSLDLESKRLVGPVWRQALDGAHLLCDTCAIIERQK